MLIIKNGKVVGRYYDSYYEIQGKCITLLVSENAYLYLMDEEVGMEDVTEDKIMKEVRKAYANYKLGLINLLDSETLSDKRRNEIIDEIISSVDNLLEDIYCFGRDENVI